MPKSQRRFPLFPLPAQQRQQTLPVHRPLLPRLHARRFQNRRKNIRRDRPRRNRPRRLQPRRPFQNRRHQQTAFVNLVLQSPESARRAHVLQRPVIAAIPQNRILPQPHFPQLLPQPPERPVHRRDFPVKIRLPLRLIRVKRPILLQRLERRMRRPKPNHRQKRLLLLRAFPNKLQRQIDRDFRTVPLERNRLSLIAQNRIQIEKIRRRNPLVESLPARIHRTPRLHRPQMPFPKMPRPIPRFPQPLRQRCLLRPHRMSPRKRTRPIRRPPRQNARPRRRANRSRRVKPVKPDSLRRHRVEIRRPQNRMPVICHISPTLIVRHHQNNIRPLPENRRAANRAPSQTRQNRNPKKASQEHNEQPVILPKPTQASAPPI